MFLLQRSMAGGNNAGCGLEPWMSETLGFVAQDRVQVMGLVA